MINNYTHRSIRHTNGPPRRRKFADPLHKCSRGGSGVCPFRLLNDVCRPSFRLQDGIKYKKSVPPDLRYKNYLGAASPDLSFSRPARHRTYSCDPGLPYDLHRASSISTNVCASLRCCSIAWPAGESGGQLSCATASRHATERPAHPARRRSKIKGDMRILRIIEQLEA